MIEVLVKHAPAEHYPEVSEFTEKLIFHAQPEGEVSYSTDLLIGEQLKLKFN